MTAIVYKDSKITLEDSGITTKQLKEQFGIEERKQIYKVGEGGDLTRLEPGYVDLSGKDIFQIDAITSFELG